MPQLKHRELPAGDGGHFKLRFRITGGMLEAYLSHIPDRLENWEEYIDAVYVSPDSTTPPGRSKLRVIQFRITATASDELSVTAICTERAFVDVFSELLRTFWEVFTRSRETKEALTRAFHGNLYGVVSETESDQWRRLQEPLEGKEIPTEWLIDESKDWDFDQLVEYVGSTKVDADQMREIIRARVQVITDPQKRQAVTLLWMGYDTNEIAYKVGRVPKTVNNWFSQLRGDLPSGQDIVPLRRQLKKLERERQKKLHET